MAGPCAVSSSESSGLTQLAGLFLSPGFVFNSTKMGTFFCDVRLPAENVMLGADPIVGLTADWQSKLKPGHVSCYVPARFRV